MGFLPLIASYINAVSGDSSAGLWTYCVIVIFGSACRDVGVARRSSARFEEANAS